MTKTGYVGFRVPKNFIIEIEELRKLKKKDKSSMIREIFETGIEKERKKFAIETYKKREASLEKAAEIAKLPLTDFIDLLKKEGIYRDIDVQNIKKLLLEEFGAEV